MKTLHIEWLNYENEVEACGRCNATGSSIRDAIAMLITKKAGILL